MRKTSYKTKEIAYLGMTIFEVFIDRSYDIEGKTIYVKKIEKVLGVTYRSVTIFQ